MIQTAESFQSPLWETTGLPGPSPALWSWTAPFLSRWQTRCLLCSGSEIEGVSATVAGRGTLMKTGGLNESSHTKYWDSHHSMARPTPFSDTASLNNGYGTMPSRQDVKSTFSGQPRDFWAVCCHKEFPKKTHCPITLLWSPRSTHPTHAHNFQTGLCVCVCLLLKYEWSLRTFEVSPQETDSDKHPEKQHEGKQDYTRRRKVNFKNSINILREKKILHQSSNPKWHVN